MTKILPLTGLHCSTMPNMKMKINKHNAKILKKSSQTKPRCNCQKERKKDCPLPGKCTVESVIYKATITTDNPKIPKKFYYGLTERSFKERWYEHTSSFRNEPKNHTTLSSYYWKCLRNNLNPRVKWEVKTKAHVFSSGSKACDLCISEKTFILFERSPHMLNSRNELGEKCRHKLDHMLINCAPLPIT